MPRMGFELTTLWTRILCFFLSPILDATLFIIAFSCIETLETSMKKDKNQLRLKIQTKFYSKHEGHFAHSAAFSGLGFSVVLNERLCRVQDTGWITDGHLAWNSLFSRYWSISVPLGSVLTVFYCNQLFILFRFYIEYTWVRSDRMIWDTVPFMTQHNCRVYFNPVS